MVTRVGGARRKTRNLFRKNTRQKGKISLRRYLQELEPGQKVALAMEPAVQEGAYHHRHYGKIGKIKCRQGACYVVQVRDGGKMKEIIAHPVHLKIVE